MAQTQEFGYPEASIPPPDPEMFHRVWDRVMSREGREGKLSLPAQPPSVPQPLPLPTPEVSTEAECSQLCLGDVGEDQAGILGEMLEEICLIGRFYRAMLRQVQGNTARQLRCMAEEQQRQLRRLGVIYFLLTGEEFVYGNHGMSVPRGLRYALREMFLREGQRYCLYIQTAERVRDLCLKELLEEFAETARLHTEMIRTILEGLQG